MGILPAITTTALKAEPKYAGTAKPMVGTWRIRLWDIALWGRQLWVM